MNKMVNRKLFHPDVHMVRWFDTSGSGIKNATGKRAEG